MIQMGARKLQASQSNTCNLVETVIREWLSTQRDKTCWGNINMASTKKSLVSPVFGSSYNDPVDIIYLDFQKVFDKVPPINRYSCNIVSEPIIIAISWGLNILTDF